MSVGARTTYENALKRYERFVELFEPATVVRWSMAGSLRRGERDIGDIDHVVIPRIVPVRAPSLFVESVPANLVFNRLDDLLKMRIVEKYVHSDGRTRWGEKARSVLFEGMRHQIYCVEQDSWGAALAINTGPESMSKQLVCGLLRNGRRNWQGKVWRCVPCPAGGVAGCRCEPKCEQCQGTRLKPVEQLAAPDEESYFKLCGIPYIEPWQRF